MISLKWKIFRLANLIQLLYLLGFIVFLVITFIKDRSPDTVFYILFFLSFLAMACNNYVNLFVFNNYFPDKPVPPKLEKINTGLFIAGIILAVLFSIMIIAASLYEFNEPRRNYSGKIVILIFAMALVHWIYILYMQIKMFTAIRRGHYRSIDTMIDWIGRE